MKDYYSILGINQKADFKDVIEAYNKSILYFNNKEILDSTDKKTIKEIKEAFYILGNYHNRRKYDNNLEGFKKVNESFSDRVFFRPEINYSHNIDERIRNSQSDIMNNKKNRLQNKEFNIFH